MNVTMKWICVKGRRKPETSWFLQLRQTNGMHDSLYEVDRRARAWETTAAVCIEECEIER
jgi:hypothetical protein